MKKTTSQFWVNALVGVALCSILFAFTAATGAHSVRIYLDGKLMVEQYISSKSETARITLDPDGKHNQLMVRYNECGRTVSGRKITLKDSNDKVLKEWRFEGSSTGFEGSMECATKDILQLKSKESNTLKLCYSSNDFPDGGVIAYLIIGGNTSTASK